MKITDIDKMQNIKLLLNYCKRMSSLVISSYNKEKYDNKKSELFLVIFFGGGQYICVI